MATSNFRLAARIRIICFIILSGLAITDFPTLIAILIPILILRLIEHGFSKLASAVSNPI